MAYAPGNVDRSGELLAGGIMHFADSIARGIGGAIIEKDKEEKQRAREFKSLIEYADAAGIATRDSLMTKSLDEAKGIVRAGEMRRMEKEKALAQSRQDKLDNLRMETARFNMDRTARQDEAALLQNATDAEAQRVFGELMSQTGGEVAPIAPIEAFSQSLAVARQKTGRPVSPRTVAGLENAVRYSTPKAAPLSVFEFGNRLVGVDKGSGQVVNLATNPPNPRKPQAGELSEEEWRNMPLEELQAEYEATKKALDEGVPVVNAITGLIEKLDPKNPLSKPQMRPVAPTETPRLRARANMLRSLIAESAPAKKETPGDKKTGDKDVTPVLATVDRPPRPATAGQPLDAQMAARFLVLAGGDKNIARKLAVAAGWAIPQVR